MKVSKKIIVLSGPSGVGKSTLINILLSSYADVFEFSISATTRAPRAGEEHGKDYYFFSEEEFRSRVDKGEFVEYEEVYPGRFYGTLKSEVTRITERGNIAIFDIDVLGGVNIKSQYADDAYTIFVKPESIESLHKRLIDRGTENKDQIQVRINRFEKELSYENKFDTVLINRTGKIEEAKQEIISRVEKNCFKNV